MTSSFRVVIVCSGPEYQAGAAYAAASFRLVNHGQAAVDVYVPSTEVIDSALADFSNRYNFGILQFDFRPVSDKKRTSQLKCQGFVAALEESVTDAPVLFVDADTCCVRPLLFPVDVVQAVCHGSVAMTPDVRERHATNPRRPWYVPPQQRSAYVNSGVILCGRAALDIFYKCRELSVTEPFLRGPFNDQKVLNFVLGKHFFGRLLLLDVQFNGMRAFRSDRTVIMHFAGGAGRFHTTSRRDAHLQCCQSVIERALSDQDSE